VTHHHAARLLTLSATVLEPLKEAAILRFRIDQPLDRKEPNFANDLMLNLRLLREAVGEARIYRADLSDEDFARLQSVDWELLPQGSAHRVLERLGNSGRVHSARMKQLVRDCAFSTGLPTPASSSVMASSLGTLALSSAIVWLRSKTLNTVTRSMSLRMTGSACPS
jgi:hypothetical protein